ncbi:tRNA uridine-5-carboxymethylaminomethyl(34) synthesis GTPase MnmE [Blautia luti]|uniref:tRNA modification GTPase MnmE n=1 Tax=Blautia luti DSM 14534 = JCM 17040 TaxID=649762 RepID=A0A844GKC9_9FIRM|nr:tRNA uridine-5-carboxymethylaminomethyl(34) synthesis GTPase MnmE [Blautia luti]MTD61068.1 tRNA uridine-5-carboxymethylaminomethyl(34) synthesis GTPase MnmE [Blautia luti DSM 14534 = JCM 17040]RHQ88980.1 tRNA uridine-5-carboxymethylaminomethyl(34) synthesis GTPase MnmE [Ruminococcus sp. AF21-42]BEI62397.1 tRNA uridine-5-carboxymethylaminomethyl(34) synthesis GTPase MnmE [Blautia luti]
METTIAAISTAMSASGIGIVRISGENAMDVISRIYRSKGGKKKIKEVPSHTIHYGYIYNGEELVDEVLVMIMRAPRTFTGEDTVEIDCHGGVYAMKRVLETVLKNGAEIAGPGEFTKRAFLNGRLDLSQAEAVMDVIQAKNDYALKSSMEQLRGSVQKAIRDIREKLIYHIAYIESALDDPEHISLDGYPQELLEVVDKEQQEVKRLLKSSSDGKIIQEGIQTVILGKPNAGKSSLLNLLLGENRAIVTDIAGTTRDILEEYITLHGITLKITDTAGIRETEDIVEKIGVDKAREMAQKADLILYVVDSSVPLDENDEEIMSMLGGKKAIILYNKTDLTPVIPLEELREKTGHPVIPISAKEETGIMELEDKVKEMFFGGELSFNDEVYITNARHKAALEEADKSLDLVRNSIEMGMPEDFFSIDLMNAYENLGKILGESVGEDLVNEIFSKFCMGK